MTVQSVSAVAPARVNIIGEPTDYNEGLVLPTCTALFTRVSAKRRADRQIVARSETFAETSAFALDALRPGKPSGWIDYVQGVVAGLMAAGFVLPGADLEIDSEIPLGAGLSSSAALELAVARALLGLANGSVVSARWADAKSAAAELALLCQQAEHEYAGVHCGIMDQYAIAAAQRGKALLLDCRSMRIRQIDLPGELSFILTDSGERHSLADGSYNERAAECAAAVSILAKEVPQVTSLRDVNAAMLEQYRGELGELLYRRCRHVITENQRVSDTVAALEQADVQQVGALLSACQASLRDDFEISCAAIDTLVACADDSRHVLGSRMVGGGFGGCVLSACRSSEAQAAAADIRRSYATISGTQPWQHQVMPAHPAQILEAQS